MKSIKDYFKCMFEAGNKVSSARFFMIVTLAISCVLYCIIGFILIVDVCNNKSITTDLNGLSSFITAVSVNLGIGGLTKIGSAYMEKRNQATEEE